MFDVEPRGSVQVDVHKTVSFFNSSPTSLNSMYGDIFTDVDLPYDPFQNPILATVYFLFKTVIIVIGEYLHVQILKFLKHETCIVKEVLKAFLYVQMVYWPVKVVFETSTDLVYPLKIVIGEWYCHIAFLWLVFGMTLIVFHSFIVGLMRYTFVVHHQKTLEFGIDGAKNLFYWISILVPLIVTIWGFVGRRQISSVSSLNKCYGTYVEAFLVEENVKTITAKSFCAFEKYDTTGSQAIASLKRIFCILHTFIYVIMGINVVEGIFYWRTVKFSNK